MDKLTRLANDPRTTIRRAGYARSRMARASFTGCSGHSGEWIIPRWTLRLKRRMRWENQSSFSLRRYRFILTPTFSHYRFLAEGIPDIADL